MFQFAKNKKLLKSLDDYLRVATEAVDNFLVAINYVLKSGVDEKFEVMVEKTHKSESNADDMRRKIEADMYSKSLLPESQEDLLDLIERIDKIPGKAQSVLYQILTENLVIPKLIHADIHELVQISHETCHIVIKATSNLFGERDEIREFVRLVDNNESICDSLERKTISKIFKSDISDFQKIILKELIIEIGELTDICETAADRITIFNIKRSI